MRSALGEHELTYLHDIRHRLRDVPATRRRELLDQASDHLAERPPAASFDQLLRALGSPKLYAEELRAASGIPARVNIWRRFVGQRRLILVAEITTAGALLIGSLIAWSWFTAVPSLVNNCGGVRATHVESREAAGQTEYLITFDAQTRVGILLCLGSRDKGIEIDGIHSFEGPLSPLQPVGVEVLHPLRRLSGDVARFVPFDPADDLVDNSQQMLWFEWDYCGFYRPGDSTSISSVTIDYRYRGRHLSVQVDLHSTYTAQIQECRGPSGEVLPPEDALARDEATRDRWVESNGGVNRWDTLEIGPIHLYPEGISRDLCRFLRGIPPAITSYGEWLPGATESLEDRAVFNLGRSHNDLAIKLIDGAVGGVCPEFATRRDELVAMVDPDLVVPDDSP